jgi:hypothetical protein
MAIVNDYRFGNLKGGDKNEHPLGSSFENVLDGGVERKVRKWLHFSG